MTSAGSVSRLPAERPNSAQAANSAAGFAGLRHRQQRGGLARHRPGREAPHVEPVGERAEHEAPGDRGDGQRRDRKPDLGAAEHRLEERDLMHQEADLRGQRQRERRRHAPECQAAQRAPPRPGGRRRRGRTAAIAAGAAAGRSIQSAIDRQQHHGDQQRRAEHGVGEAVVGDRQHQRRRDQDAAGARAVEREAEREPALAVEPQADHVADRADVHRGGADRHDQIGGDRAATAR